jgi:hypothetical protein
MTQVLPMEQKQSAYVSVNCRLTILNCSNWKISRESFNYRAVTRLANQGEVLYQFHWIKEKFAVNSILSIYSLYKMTSPIAQRREVWSLLGDHFSPSLPLVRALNCLLHGLWLLSRKITSVDPDQPEHLCLLIRVYAVSCLNYLIGYF